MDANAVLIVAALVVLVAVVVVLVRGERAQAALATRLQHLNESQSAAQAQVSRTLEERLDAVSHRLGEGLTQHGERTSKTIGALQERLAVIDAAQKNITELSQEVVGLQDVLSNKQTRGAFGEIQLRDLVANTLPASAFDFQVRLGNDRVVDCMVRLPNPPGPIGIDSKFPLEGYRAINDAGDEAALVQARRAFSRDLLDHVKAIGDKYIVPGETADWAIMFLPSEAVFAETHANFPNIVEEAHRRRVAIVSPTTLMATLVTVRAILKDVQMKEQAGRIQVEAARMLDDVRRLEERVGRLQSHFGNAGKAIDEISTSIRKISRSGERITEVQFDDDAEALAPPGTQGDTE